MRAIRYINRSAEKAFPKDLVSQEPAGSTGILVEFKDDTNMLHPTLKMSLDAAYMTFNYIYLEDLHRYYFVKNITFSQQYALIECDVDVLESWKNELRNQSVIYSRQSYSYNSYQRDSELPMMEYGDVDTVKPGDRLTLLDASVHMTYLLVTTGGGGSQ